MIQLKNLQKTYNVKNMSVHAVKDVNLHIKKGEIVGIIGYSGAGKSSLIRCINLLERPDSGEVIINNRDITKLSDSDLRKARKKIGMIFQHFNLMDSRDVFDNIAYPLNNSNLKKDEIENKVNNLLTLVGLRDKAHSYPSQLSGGQKQRVAIARALANDPEILLCDEATSALDPETTLSILELLKKINKELGLTIALITHQMEVIKEICHKVAIMEKGQIVENGDVVDIFSKPKAEMTKKFVSSIFNNDKIVHFLSTFDLKNDEQVIKLSYVGSKAEEAYISKISREFELDASILFGNIEIIQNVPIGNLVVMLKGDDHKLLGAVHYLNSNNIYTEVLKNARTSL